MARDEHPHSGAMDGMALPGAFALFKVLLLLAVLGRYGIFRDEYYYLACAGRPDWGYVDHPPLSIAFLAVWTGIFGDGLWALRLPGIALGAATVLLAGLITQEMGGRRFAQSLACLGVLIAPIFLAVSNFYSMNVFDQFFWAVLTWVLVRFLNTGDARYWLLFGLIAGLALQNKISVLVLGLGLVCGLILTRHRAQFLKKELWMGGAIAGLLFLPHLLWQVRNGYPTLEFLHNASTMKNTDSSPIALFLGTLLEMHPANALIWIPGLFFTLYGGAGKRYRLLGVTFIGVFLVFGFTNGKGYYLAPAMPMLLALGGVVWERWTRDRPWGRASVLAPLVLLGPVLMPLSIPVLPPAQFIVYQARLGIGPTAGERHEQGALPQHFADRFGWKELAEFIDEACTAHLPEERERAVVLVGNYGEAGALEYYKDVYNLPRVICPHNNYYLWGPGEVDGKVVLAYGFDKASLERHFESVVVSAERFNHPLAMPYQNNRPLFICRSPRMPLDEVWPRVKRFI